MRFQIHFGFEDYEFLFLAFSIQTQKMIVSKMLFQSSVVDIILVFPALQPSIADVAPFVFISAVRVQFVVTVKSGPTEPTLRMTSKPALV